MPRKMRTTKKTGKGKRPMRSTRGRRFGNYSVGTTRNTNIVNKQKRQIHYYKDTVPAPDIDGGASGLTNVTGVLQFDIGQVARYSTLQSMYRQYKVNSIKIRLRLKTGELTDNAIHPHILCRYNYDPNLLIGSVNEAFMLRQQNVVSKQFIHNTPDGCTLEYTIKPAIMQAVKLWNTSSFSPSPKFNQWIDFATSASNEFAQYGFVYWINNVPANQIIDFDVQYNYCCRDII